MAIRSIRYATDEEIAAYKQHRDARMCAKGMDPADPDDVFFYEDGESRWCTRLLRKITGDREVEFLYDGKLAFNTD